MADRIEYRPPTALQRVRSAALLVLLVVVLGTVAAGLIGVIVVAGVSLIDHALG